MAPTISRVQRDQLLLAAQGARDASYSPYSNFRVGAALLTESGEIIPGANVENASYGAGICAERTALVKAITSGHKSFLAIAVSSDLVGPCSPCGICRQFIREFCALSLPIMMVSSDWRPRSSVGDHPTAKTASDAAKRMAQPYADDARPSEAEQQGAIGQGARDAALVHAKENAQEEMKDSEDLQEEEGVTIRTLGQMLPLSFGPSDLDRDRA